VEWINVAQNRDQGSYEHATEPSGSRKGGEFFDQMSDYWPLKKDSAPWN